MSRGFAKGQVSGNVGEPVVFAPHLVKGELACSFMLACERSSRAEPVWIKVNVYGGNVIVCRKYLGKGANVTVTGDLVNRGRQSGDVGVELRCEEIIFHDKTYEYEEVQEAGDSR